MIAVHITLLIVVNCLLWYCEKPYRYPQAPENQSRRIL
jgi:hypothetical protein